MSPRSLRELDYVPGGVALVVAVSMGVLVGFGFFSFDGATAALGYALMLTFAAWLALSGRPIAVLGRRTGEPEIPTVLPKAETTPSKGEAEFKKTIASPESIDDLALENIPAGHFIRDGKKISISAFQCMKYLVTRRLYQ